MVDVPWDDVKWVYTSVAVPIAGWFIVRWRRRRDAKVARERRAEHAYFARRQEIDSLIGLPPECKTVLYSFYAQGTHTRRLNPEASAVQLLVSRRILIKGPGGGTYDAIDRYMTVVPAIWALLPEWLAEDPPADLGEAGADSR
ncbi:hypothetical protein D9M68_123750 [compost metagenome]